MRAGSPENELRVFGMERGEEAKASNTVVLDSHLYLKIEMDTSKVEFHVSMCFGMGALVPAPPLLPPKNMDNYRNAYIFSEKNDLISILESNLGLYPYFFTCEFSIIGTEPNWPFSVPGTLILTSSSL